MNRKNWLVWISRLLIAVVFFFNVYCAYLFLVFPERYAPAYELAGEIGGYVVQGFGILFLMWNVPYFVALLNPFLHFVSLLEALTMQLIGVIGEGLIWRNIEQRHAIISGSIGRFLVFDLVGLILLSAAVWIGFKHKNAAKAISPGKEKSTVL